MKIANNVIALNVANNMSKADKRVAVAMGRLSSGLKINRAKDDSAGYAISNRLNMQNQGYVRGAENALDGISLLETAEAALSSVHELIQRCRELSVQSATDTYSNEERRLIDQEVQGYLDEIDTISKNRSFNGIEFLNGHAQRMTIDSNPDVSQITYASDNLLDGTLNYTINSIGTPVSLATGYDNSLTSSVNGTINIGGTPLEISSTDSSTDIYNKILLACKDNNLTFDNATGKFTSNEFGSKNTIEITGDDAVLSALGFSSTTLTKGTDAEITVDSYVKADGTIDNTYKPSILSDGNEVTLTSSNGGIIEIKINPFDPITGAPTATGKQSSEITNRGFLNLQLGGTTNAVLDVHIPKVSKESLDLDHVNVSTRDGANTAIKLFDDAITEVSTIRARIGAYENRLTYTEESLNVASDATVTSLSRIRDTDMAKEMANYTQYNVIFQAGTSILAQANQRPQTILQLIS